jgi:hypothetical protein
MKPIYNEDGTIETYIPLSLVSWETEKNTEQTFGDSSRVIAFVGDASGGVPNQPYTFTNISDAKRILKSGPLLTGLLLSYNAAVDNSNRPAAFVAVNTKPATRGRVDLLGSGTAIVITGATGSTSTNLVVTALAGLTGPIPIGTRLTFTGGKIVQTTAEVSNAAINIPIVTISGGAIAAADVANYVEASFILEYGHRESANLASYAFSGSALTGYTFAFSNNDASDPVNFTVAGLGLLIELKYSGAGTASYQVVTVGSVKYLNLNSTVAIENFALPLEEGSTIRQAVDNINGLSAVWSARVIPTDGNCPATNLDLNVAVVPTANNALVNLGGYKGHIAYELTKPRGFSSFATYTNGPSATVAVTSSGLFAGGTSGASTLTNWSDAVDALLEIGFGSIVPCTSDPTFTEGVRGAVLRRNHPTLSRYCQLIFGYNDAAMPVSSNSAAILGWLNVAEAFINSISDAGSLCVASTGVIADPVTDVARKGKTWEIAAMVAGVKASYGAIQPLSRKRMRVSAAFPKMVDSQKNRATKIGLTCLEDDLSPAVSRIIRDRTTYVGADDAIQESAQRMGIIFAIARTVKDVQDKLVLGNPANATNLIAFQEAIEKVYVTFKERGYIVEGKRRDNAGQLQVLKAFELSVFTATQGAQRVFSRATINPVGEFVMGEHKITARTYDLEVN